jgi:hypothetical protein
MYSATVIILPPMARSSSGFAIRASEVVPEIFMPNTCGAGALFDGLEIPVPVSETWSGELAAFVSRLNVAVRDAAPVGVNTKE